MKINIKKLPVILCSFIVISCNTGQDKNIKTDDIKELKPKADKCIYSFSDSTIKLFWAGYKTTDKLNKHIEEMALNKVNIEFLRKQMDKVLEDIEKLKDANREIKYTNGSSQ